ncbi:hypothetical protein [Curtobacterium sp. MCBD17_032]|uniref:hypothetical protein n=1 Tax=Curtobacterium sp. MCBD17_032 TaxID=2175659 RepID=UPI000DA81269|nr:hypothetical protein [Curtobacterium sp. MCBD17_032]PZE86256.1 hypothetical protein DEI91_03900 [Curtobacterium sp. MCBD17_032]
MVELIVLVMAEYMVDDSPLWYRGSREHVGVADAEGLGLSASLRDDLRAWNDVYDSRSEPDFAWSSAEERDAHRVTAFTLASRVQLELGDDAHVWCGAGQGIDMVASGGRAVVLTSNQAGTDVLFLRDGNGDRMTARAAGLREGTAKAIVRWRAVTERVDRPFGGAETRALGLRTAGRMQSDLGTEAQVVFTAGVWAPDRHDQVD